MNKKILLGLLAFCAATFNLRAVLVDLELALVIDGSGSISAAEFQLQKQGYINALLAVMPTDGSVAVSVWQFGSVGADVEDIRVNSVFTQRVIYGPADLYNLAGSLQGMQQIGGFTPIGEAILTAAMHLSFPSVFGPRQVIDVSTDGFGTPNFGTSQVNARNFSLSQYHITQINGLGIGPDAVLDFVGGTGSFGVIANDYGDFQSTLEAKLRREISGASVPEAGSTGLLALFGLLGLGALHRRDQKAGLLVR